MVTGSEVGSCRQCGLRNCFKENSTTLVFGPKRQKNSAKYVVTTIDSVAGSRTIDIITAAFTASVHLMGKPSGKKSKKC
jgi:hypothetical protein